MTDLEKSQQRANRAQQGGKKRSENLSKLRRSEIARKAAEARWKNESDQQAFSRGSDSFKEGALTVGEQVSSREEILELQKLSKADVNPVKSKDAKLPQAIFWGVLDLMSQSIPCYVLNNSQRIIGRTAANEMLTSIKGAGDFEKTIGVRSLKPFLDAQDISNRLVAFSLPDVEGLGVNVKGLPADMFIDVCQAFVKALEDSQRRRMDGQFRDYPPLTDRQTEMALQASLFLAAVAKVGLDALIDEATGYQEIRTKDALEVKLKAYLEDEMRKWEKTFPDELWMEFGRLTNWKGSIHKRPKYWGKLVMELIYGYLDSDVADWLRENAPKPRGGRNYHQWLSNQYGLQKLVQHIWQVIGMAKGCDSMSELKERMAYTFGNEPIQLTLKISRDS